MGRDHRRHKREESDEARLKALYESVRKIRKPIPPPGKFIDPKKRRSNHKPTTRDYLESLEDDNLN